MPVFARLWPVRVRVGVSFTTGAVRSAIRPTSGLLVTSATLCTAILSMDLCVCVCVCVCVSVCHLQALYCIETAAWIKIVSGIQTSRTYPVLYFKEIRVSIQK